MTRLLAHVSRAVTLPFRRGLTGSLATLRYRCGEWWSERYLGIRTLADSEHGIEIEGGECIDYEPLSYECLRTILDRLDPGPGDVFLDYGSGLGRPCVLAATRPFARVIGVEFQPELAERGRENLERSRRRHRCGAFEIVTADATAYVVPDDVTVVYLFNPFIGSVMAATQERLRESLERIPRRMRIVYMTPPDQPDLFAEVPWVGSAATLPTGHWDGCRLTIYETATAPHD